MADRSMSFTPGLERRLQAMPYRGHWQLLCGRLFGSLCDASRQVATRNWTHQKLRISWLTSSVAWFTIKGQRYEEDQSIGNEQELMMQSLTLPLLKHQTQKVLGEMGWVPTSRNSQDNHQRNDSPPPITRSKATYRQAITCTYASMRR